MVFLSQFEVGMSDGIVPVPLPLREVQFGISLVRTHARGLLVNLSAPSVQHFLKQRNLANKKKNESEKKNFIEDAVL